MKESADAVPGSDNSEVDRELVLNLLQRILGEGNILEAPALADSKLPDLFIAKDAPKASVHEKTRDRESSEKMEKPGKDRATILIVEDREADREMLATLLEHARYRVLEAADGPRALELARSAHPDLIISDVLLPKMDGYQLVRQLRADPALSGISVIFYTAVFNEREAMDLAREIGVVRILSKPTEPEKILESVAAVLKSMGVQPPSPPPAAFEQKHLQLLVDKLIDRVKALQRSEERLKEKTQTLQGINRIFHEALTCDTEEELARTCLEVAKSLTGSKFALMGKVNQARKLEITHRDWAPCSSGKADAGLVGGLQDIGVFFETIIADGRSLIVNGLGGRPGSNAGLSACPPLTAFLGAPLKYADRTIGLIALGSTERSYEPADQEALESLSFAIVEALLRKSGEAALRQAREELEWRVEERTADLKRAVSQLQEEIVMRQQAEEELRILNEGLEARVRERTAELEAANNELESFSYSVAHDLHTPLRAIEGFSRMLGDEHTDRLDAEGLRLLKIINDNAKIMHRLIDDLLALARLGRQQMRKSYIHLGAMAEQIFHRLETQTKGRDLQLTLKDLPPAYGDPSLLNQVMINLLANALKFTKSRETARIEVGGRTEGTENIYYVKDNGIGFDGRYGDKIFGLFQRLHGGEEYEGTGVGLAIVQRIIHRHGGRVWAEGKINEGATVYFALPKNGEPQFSPGNKEMDE